MPATDSGYAWLIPFVCFFIQAALFGSYRVYGLLYTVLIDAFNVSRSAAAWPFSLCMTFIHLTGELIISLRSKRSNFNLDLYICIRSSIGTFEQILFITSNIVRWLLPRRARSWTLLHGNKCFSNYHLHRNHSGIRYWINLCTE